MRVAVIGGGIIGFSCALRILEHYKSSSNANIEVVVISEEFTPNTTGDGSAGLWGPYILAGSDTKLIHQWAKSSHKFFERIWLSADAGEAGVCLIPCKRVTTFNGPNITTFWHDIVHGCIPLSREQLEVLNKGNNRNFNAGYQFTTFTAEPIKLLPYLMKRFKNFGGIILQQKVNNLSDFVNKSNFDVICNCTGLGAKNLVPDSEMYPVRGQVIRIKANWIYGVFMDESDDGRYIIPNVDSVVLGGTHQENDFNTLPSKEDKEFIMNGCLQIIPAIKNAKQLNDWVGLRPSRTQVRLEKTKIGDKILIHNYGHGGSGVTLAWGCADHVLNLIKTEFDQENNYKSKL